MIYDSAIQTLADIANILAQRHPNSKALIFQDRYLTYLELDRQSDRVANALFNAGIQTGSRVGFLAKDGLPGYQILFGCAKIGAVLVPINWRLTAPEIAYILEDAEVELLFVGSPFARLAAEIAPELDRLKTIVGCEGRAENWFDWDAWLSNSADTAPDVTVRPEDVAVQMYTSGTTGRPKGVQLAHYSFFAIAKAFAESNQRWIGWHQRDKSLIALPLFHIGGLWWAIRGLVAGAENVLLESFIPADALRAIETHRITKTCLVPAAIQSMLTEPSCRQTYFSSLETIVYGGSPIAETLLTAAMQTFACDFVQIYGMTETGNCAVTLPHQNTLGKPQRLQAAGKPFPGVSVAIFNSQQEPLKQGEIGEVCLKSPANMVGYWKLPEATASTSRDGWIHTGDAGYLDEDGYLYICDRIKDMICYAGENVYPAEIENVLYQHPAIAEVAVIGVPDPKWGEAIKALVVLKPGREISALDLINFARERLANFKLPRSVEFIDSLPRTPSGKVQKGKLREPYWQGYRRRVN